jgi:AraC-like DNA-binding protein
MVRRTKRHETELARIRSVIDGLALEGTVSLRAAARQLGTSPRTLQRRLNAHGVGFWALAAQSRFEIAIVLLHGTDLKVQEIAAALGYSTPGGFARAFTSWAGHPPSAYRNAPADRHITPPDWREMGRNERRRPLSSKDIPHFPKDA